MENQFEEPLNNQIYMKPIYTFLLFSYFITTGLYAQDTLDCENNLSEAFYFLKGDAYVKPDSLKALEFLKPCVKAKNPAAQLLMARLYLNGKDEKRFKKGFKLTKKAAKQDFALAAYDLGVLFKYGKGRKQNLKKATKWFRKGYKLGNPKAAYSLGYMFFKGFGNETQDYKKAVRWFKKSDTPMAKHWLAVCYYFGYGVHQNKSKALQLLKENPIENSERLLNTLTRLQGENDLSADERYVLNQFQERDNSINDSKVNNLVGTWLGTFIQLDWSNTMLMQKLPVSINFEEDPITSELVYKSIIGDNYNTGEVLNNTSLENLSLKIKHPYSSNATAVLDYEIIPSEIEFIHHNNHEFMVFSAESFIDGWKEPGAPMLLILSKEKMETASNVELSNEVVSALEAQEDSFIKLYPNPFENDLIIGYDLDSPLHVSVNITSTDGSKSYVITSNSLQNSGRHTYTFDGSSLEKGIYVINITYGNERATKMILKN
ncbi:MAG: T9SS type A sorting domain-containing protein [Candidatus Lokiarchaeia archaeon]